MNIKVRICILLLFVFFFEPLFSQIEEVSDYYKIKKNYENKQENDSSVLPSVRNFITKARSEKQYFRLVEGYKDALLFSPSPGIKLKYADSAVWAAKLTRDNGLIGKAITTKGIVYYFNFKKYDLALNELLVANNYFKNIDDPYYKNKITYLLGVVKSYIGYYDEALVLFQQSRLFFEEESDKDLHSNAIYGNRRGYFNSLHQMAVCYRNLGNQKLADSITDLGLFRVGNDKNYQQERSYFLKEKGISRYYKRDYANAIAFFKGAISGIAPVNDFSWITVCYSYIGKSYEERGDTEEGLRYLRRVDSVFRRHNFILPEVRDSYEILIDYYRGKSDVKKQLYYTTQLIKVDETLARDYTYLSSKIHREYDTKRLLDEKNLLEQEVKYATWSNTILFAFTVVLIMVMFFRYKRERQFHKNYRILERNILNAHRENNIDNVSKKEECPLGIEKKITDELLRKLDEFEEKSEFTEVGLTLSKLAIRFDTNQKYLSSIINKYKGMNFNRYITELRISYITKKLYNEKKYLHYKIETLAEECGIASRNNFSDLFFQINGIRPTDFIRRRLEDLFSMENEKGADNRTKQMPDV